MHQMFKALNAGDKLYHRHRGIVNVVSVQNNDIYISTRQNEIIHGNLSEFGQVIFFEKDHMIKRYPSTKVYLAFCIEKIRLNLQLEEKIKQSKERMQMKMKISGETLWDRILSYLSSSEEELQTATGRWFQAISESDKL